MQRKVLVITFVTLMSITKIQITEKNLVDNRMLEIYFKPFFYNYWAVDITLEVRMDPFIITAKTYCNLSYYEIFWTFFKLPQLKKLIQFFSMSVGNFFFH